MKNIIGLVNFHSSPEILPITESRPLGSTSFLGRYAFCDFALSNLCNSGISTVGLLVKDHQRSILKHLGSMDAWQSNTKLSQTVVMFNESAHGKPAYNTDVANIKENDWVIYNSTATHLVIVPAHIVATIDLDAILREHIERHEYITVVATRVEHAENEYLNQPLIQMDSDNYLTSFKLNKGKVTGEAIASMSTIIINRTTLAQICSVEATLEPKKGLRDLLLAYSKRKGSRIHVHMFDGFSRCIDSYEHYIKYSFELLNPENNKALFQPNLPVYTLTHDTKPAMYGREAKVTDSFIANGAIIEGTVDHCIVARDVYIGKGAVVRNSIIFSSTKIDDGAHVEDAIIDKYSIVTKDHSISGIEGEFAYIRQGAII